MQKRLASQSSAVCGENPLGKSLGVRILLTLGDDSLKVVASDRALFARRSVVLLVSARCLHSTHDIITKRRMRCKPIPCFAGRRRNDDSSWGSRSGIYDFFLPPSLCQGDLGECFHASWSPSLIEN